MADQLINYLTKQDWENKKQGQTTVDFVYEKYQQEFVKTLNKYGIIQASDWKFNAFIDTNKLDYIIETQKESSMEFSDLVGYKLYLLNNRSKKLIRQQNSNKIKGILDIQVLGYRKSPY